MSRLRHIPFRMCIGCGRRREKGEMIRFSRDASGSVLIEAEKFQGRGYYLCSNLACLTAARKRMKRLGLLNAAGFEGLISQITLGKKQEEEEWQK